MLVAGDFRGDQLTIGHQDGGENQGDDHDSEYWQQGRRFVAVEFPGQFPRKFVKPLNGN